MTKRVKTICRKKSHKHCRNIYSRKRNVSRKKRTQIGGACCAGGRKSGCNAWC